MRASDIRKGQAVRMEGKLFVITNADHNTPGNLRAKVQFKLRDVSKGTIQDKRVGQLRRGRAVGDQDFRTLRDQPLGDGNPAAEMT